MEFLGSASIPVITVIAFLVAQAIKATPLDEKWLPVICGGVGAILGVIAMLTMPEFPAHDVISALAYGIVSGLGATGAHQIYKQQTKTKGSGQSE